MESNIWGTVAWGRSPGYLDSNDLLIDYNLGDMYMFILIPHPQKMNLGDIQNEKTEHIRQ